MITKTDRTYNNNKTVLKLKKDFKETQRKRLESMVNPSLYKKSKLFLWKLYWKFFMPDYIKVDYSPFGPYFYFETEEGERFSVKSRVGMKPEEVRKNMKYYYKRYIE